MKISEEKILELWMNLPVEKVPTYQSTLNFSNAIVEAMNEKYEPIVKALQLCKEALDWNIGGEPLGSLEIEAHKAATRALEQYDKQT